jgi:REP element-mobilizing transposase RayT
MSYWRLFYHIVFATKNREPLITRDFYERLYGVIVAKAEALGARLHAIGGMEDHLHLVVSVPPSVSLSSFVGQIKGTSSHFVNHALTLPYRFGWQKGYGVVSFGEKRLETVRAYVQNQQRHHAEASSISFLERAQSQDDISS